MNKSKLFECSLGFHVYGVPNKKFVHILMCKHCKKFGYYKDSEGSEHYYEYNENGDLIHYKRGNEFESYFEHDNKGNCIYYKDSCGYERWTVYDKNENEIYSKDNRGNEEWLHDNKWTSKKPENWKYEGMLI